MSYETNLASIIKTAVQCPVQWGWNFDSQQFPIVTLITISEPSDFIYDGPNGYRSVTVQLDVFAKTYGAAAQIKNQLQALNGYHGTGVVHRILFNNISSSVDTSGTEPLSRQIIRLTVWFTANS